MRAADAHGIAAHRHPARPGRLARGGRGRPRRRAARHRQDPRGATRRGRLPLRARARRPRDLVAQAAGPAGRQPRLDARRRHGREVTGYERGTITPFGSTSPGRSSPTRRSPAARCRSAPARTGWPPPSRPTTSCGPSAPMSRTSPDPRPDRLDGLARRLFRIDHVGGGDGTAAGPRVVDRRGQHETDDPRDVCAAKCLGDRSPCRATGRGTRMWARMPMAWPEGDPVPAAVPPVRCIEGRDVDPLLRDEVVVVTRSSRSTA